MNFKKKVKERKMLRTIASKSPEELGIKKVGSGLSSNCYVDEESNTVYKLFKTNSFETNSISPFILYKLKKLKLNRIAFPQNIITKHFQIKGVSYDYIEGETLEKFINNDNELHVKKFIEFYNDLMKVIPYLSKNNVEIFDLHTENMIINDNGFYFIDVDPWNISKNINKTQSNINEINRTMWVFITSCNLIFDDPNHIIKDKRDFKETFAFIAQTIPLSYNIGRIIEEIQDIINTSFSYSALIDTLYSFNHHIMETEKKHNK